MQCLKTSWVDPPVLFSLRFQIRAVESPDLQKASKNIRWGPGGPGLAHGSSRKMKWIKQQLWEDEQQQQVESTRSLSSIIYSSLQTPFSWVELHIELWCLYAKQLNCICCKVNRSATVPPGESLQANRMRLRWGYWPGGEEVVDWVPGADKNLGLMAPQDHGFTLGNLHLPVHLHHVWVVI